MRKCEEHKHTIEPMETIKCGKCQSDTKLVADLAVLDVQEMNDLLSKSDSTERYTNHFTWKREIVYYCDECRKFYRVRDE